jgi:hypothetical protein
MPVFGHVGMQIFGRPQRGLFRAVALRLMPPTGAGASTARQINPNALHYELRYAGLIGPAVARMRRADVRKWAVWCMIQA